MALGALSCAAGLSACSVEASAPPSSIAIPAPMAPVTAAKAMSVEGTWATDCVYSQGTYTKTAMTFLDNGINGKVDVFYSSSCLGTPAYTAKIEGTMMRAGVSFWVKGGHDVEITFIESDGSKRMERTVVLVENGRLYFSDADATTPGQWPTNVDRSLPYYPVGGAK